MIDATRRIFGRTFATLVLALALGISGLTAADAVTPTSTSRHCSKWVKIANSTPVAARTCVRLEKSRSLTLIIGRFSIRNRAKAAKVVSFFPQAEAHRKGSSGNTQLGGDSGHLRIPAHKSITQTRRTTMVTGSTMWMMAQYLMYRHHTYSNFVNSPHVRPPWG